MALSYIVGIDGGGTKTECVALRLADGEHRAARGPGSNYQGCGIARAREVWSGLLTETLSAFGACARDVAAAGLGIAGLDRPKDETVIRGAFQELLPGVPMELTNDAYLALRGGTPDGVGVGVVSGTGCNAMGTSRTGKRARVGGLGPDFGDLGSATDIATEALRRAFRSTDGRGPATLLVDLIRGRLSLDRLDDLVDFFLADNHEEAGLAAGSSMGPFHLGLLAPLVFEAAAAGDHVAIEVLEWAGRELGLSVRAVARALFAADEVFPLVMGGSVLQRGRTGHLRDALVADVRAEFPDVQPVVLAVRPVAGALLYALDLLGPAARPETVRRACADFLQPPFRGSQS